MMYRSTRAPKERLTGHSCAQRVRLHPAVCDSCNRYIVNTRYKCGVCDDFDLCGDCLVQDWGGHPPHVFMRITDPFSQATCRRWTHTEGETRLCSDGPQHCVMCGGYNLTPPFAYCGHCNTGPLCKRCSADQQHREYIVVWQGGLAPEGVVFSYTGTIPEPHEGEEEVEEEVVEEESCAPRIGPWSDLGKIEVVPMAKEDITRVVEIDRQCFPEEHAYPPDIFMHFIDHPNGMATVAKDKDGNCGGALLFEWNPSSRTGYVASLGVAPEYRCRGVGSQLLKHALACAWENKAKHVTLHVSVGNAPAMKLYKKVGFVEDSFEIEFYHPEPVAGSTDAFVMLCPSPDSDYVSEFYPPGRGPQQ